MKFIVFVFLILINSNSFGQEENYNIELYVISEAGLNLRTKPDLNSEKISIIDKGSKVNVVQTSNIVKVKLSNGYEGNWIKIKHKNIEGFVFDAYLSTIQPIIFSGINEDGCWNNDILLEWAESIGKVDSIDYESYQNGEGSYKMKLFNLNNKHKYIEHSHWEHVENEIQLFGLRPEEILQFTNSILKFYNDKPKLLEISNLRNQKYLNLSKDEKCCIHNLKIIISDDTLIIKTQIDPGS